VALDRGGVARTVVLAFHRPRARGARLGRHGARSVTQALGHAALAGLWVVGAAIIVLCACVTVASSGHLQPDRGAQCLRLDASDGGRRDGHLQSRQLRGRALHPVPGQRLGPLLEGGARHPHGGVKHPSDMRGVRERRSLARSVQARTENRPWSVGRLGQNVKRRILPIGCHSPAFFVPFVTRIPRARSSRSSRPGYTRHA
jgi:hypothetical protein